MEGISDIRIIGVDERHPPKIRKEPYIDLRFQLNHKAPIDWCNDLNELLTKLTYSSRIKTDEGLFIETWVRDADEIVDHLKVLKQTLAQCTETYIEKIRAQELLLQNTTDTKDQSESAQGRLNRIVAGLDYGD